MWWCLGVGRHDVSGSLRTTPARIQRLFPSYSDDVILVALLTSFIGSGFQQIRSHTLSSPLFRPLSLTSLHASGTASLGSLFKKPTQTFVRLDKPKILHLSQYQPCLRAFSSVLPRPKIYLAYIGNRFCRLKQGLVGLGWRRALRDEKARPEFLA